MLNGRLWGFSILIAVLVLTACSPQFNSTQYAKDTEQILRLTETNQVSNMDSAKYVDIVSWNILYNVNEGLMRIGPNNRPINGMASDVEISDDKKVYIFKIREEAKWHDGEPVTCYNFSYAWKRALNPSTQSEYAYMLYSIVGAEDYNKGIGSADQLGINCLDEKTLKVTLKQPELSFLSLTTQSIFFPQRKDYVEKYGEKYGKKPETLAYNGPFVIESITPQKVTLKKNENYWDVNAVTLKQVEVLIESDTPKRISYYNTGKADATKIDSEFVYAYTQTQDYVNMELASSQYLLLNQRKRFFQNANIRKAISLAIDRREITHSVLKDGSKPAGALIPPALTEGNKSYRELAGGEFVEYNPQLAREYFKKGLEELGLSSPPSSIVMLTFNDHRRHVAINIKKQLKEKLNLEVKLNAVPRPQKVDLELAGDFDMTMSSWFADYADPIGYLEIWTSDSKLNYMNFSNSEFDQLIKEAKQTSDKTVKTEKMIQAEKILVGTEEGQTASIIPIFYEANSFLQKPYVKDLYRHPYGAEYDLKWAYISHKGEQ